MPSISTAHLATPRPSPPAPHAHLPWSAMVPAACTNPDVLLLHRGIVLNHLGGSFPRTSARTYLGCSLSFRRGLHVSRDGGQRRWLPHFPTSWCWARSRGELAMGGSEVLGAGEVGGGQISCMWEAG
ncbi:hypothetical protein BDA96_01G417400 [Sorghum bicolor]|uniref:Uncharacterized protein n=2 Tax=Sorghum bicolor TaxID=4558 RepID=A0A921S3S3_SORBI|nr:hypothetical protein BDA96_01G417400 [Sorghum bicolor]OQU92700.1 hypothetical protein SORBI_3001G392650 [Sorghum bicolor]